MFICIYISSDNVKNSPFSSCLLNALIYPVLFCVFPGPLSVVFLDEWCFVMLGQCSVTVTMFCNNVQI